MNMEIWEHNLEYAEEELSLEPSAISRLNEIRVPTLVLIGDIDDPNIVKSGELLAAEIVGATRIVLAGTAHFPNMERPDEFNYHILDFFATL